MTALLTAPRTGTVAFRQEGGVGPARPALRLVGPGDDPVVAVEPRRAARRTSPAVRRRRTLLAAMGVGLVALALPLGGVGGPSHTTGPSLAGAGRPATYTVQAGDTLWSIAERMAPGADPRPTVDRLAAELGTYEVVPGEQLTLR